jgi:hypothetical protein
MQKQMIAVVERAFNWLKHINMFPSASPFLPLFFLVQQSGRYWVVQEHKHVKRIYK